MTNSQYGFNFCRRCGTKLTNKKDHVFVCENNHTLYANSSPAVAVLLLDSKNRIATLTRSIAPGEGLLDFPGGFCDKNEPVDTAVYREVEEEIGLKRDQYSELEFIYSGIDQYDIWGEKIPTVSIVFTARMINDVADLIAGDDAATANFIDINDINPDNIYFNAMRESFLKLKKLNTTERK